MMSTIADVKSYIADHAEFCDSGRPASGDLIMRAESYLRMKFPDDYILFLSEWGTLAIGPFEYYGITGDEFENLSVPNAIWYTERKRIQSSLPHEYIILSDLEGDLFICIDTSSPFNYQLVRWDIGTKRKIGTIPGSLFDFILEQGRGFFGES